ncbi:Bgt-50609 [Blumeria graminis f. sp. tritici]|uniref:Bgt-50609 n=1 Tax=Blumeria graminis f. sp. tritici TaxID=62690 RepID=A0A9X9MHM0_BLUGR|nr:Bgt-50609 [Blumeria graminis f. sp. tritici]
MEDMGQRFIRPIFWPVNSPDLNLIEAIWKRIKDVRLNKSIEKCMK